MKFLQPHIRPLFKKAIASGRNGDIYTAVKIFKKLIKIAPNWSPPYHHLSAIYKYNNDWKAAFHYGKVAIEKGATKEDTWRNLAIAATALKKWKIAQTVWKKLGLKIGGEKKPSNFEVEIIPVRLKSTHYHEIIWAKRIDPARAIIESIPTPRTDRKYGDKILIDYKVVGYRIVNGKKLPVFDELSLIKRSHYRLFFIYLYQASKNDCAILDKLCSNTNLGYDNWSQLSVNQLNLNLSLVPEYYNEDLDFELSDSLKRIAIAAPSLKEVSTLLHTWSIITLKEYKVF